MKTIPLKLCMTLLGAACSSAPTTSLLDRAHSDYHAVQSSPLATTYAALENKQAGEAMTLAENAAEQHASQEKIDQLAYVAQQKFR